MVYSEGRHGKILNINNVFNFGQKQFNYEPIINTFSAMQECGSYAYNRVTAVQFS